MRDVKDVILAVSTMGDISKVTIGGKPANDVIATLMCDCFLIYAPLTDVLNAGQRVVKAFKALGDASTMFGRPGQIRECENSMVHLEACLALIGAKQ
jgi:hypothetical protein